MSSKAIGETHPSIHTSGRVVGTTSAALGKSPSKAPRIPADPRHSDLSTSSYEAASPLHFHGLAATQTQTQMASSAEASGEGCTGSESGVAKKRKVSDGPAVRSSTKPLLKALNQPETRPTSRPASKSKRRRSPSLCSTDSFAEADEWDDPAKVFLASNRQFEVPLSELGRGTRQRGAQGGDHVMTRSSLHPINREPTQVDLPPSPQNKESLASGSKAIKDQQPVLQNEDGLSQVSDVSTDAQGRNQSPISDFPEDASTPPVNSNPGSIDRLGVPAEDDYQATQPLASDINTSQASDAINSRPRLTSPQPRSPMTSRPSSNPRSILSMVNPEKPWRLQRGKQLLQAALQSSSDGQTQPLVYPGSSHAPSTGRMLFDHLVAQMHGGQQSHLEGQNDLSPPLDEDSRETAIVPDSEPPEPKNMSSLPRSSNSNPPNKSRHGDRDDLLHSPPALVPSMAVENEVSTDDEEKDGQTDDDDDDIPLRLTVPRPSKTTAPPSAKLSNQSKVMQSRAPERSGRAIPMFGRTIGTKASSSRGMGLHNTVLPSSVPEQDHCSLAVPPTPLRTSTRQKRKERDDTEEDTVTPSTRLVQANTATDEASTEPADDLPMDTEDEASAPQDSKVRRRHPPVPLRKSAYRSAPRAASNTPSLISGTRSAKRMKTNHTMATRVFALWKQDAAYFSGIVCERVGQSDRFKINFDDGDEEVVDMKNLRRLELRIGDRVSIIESQEKATVASVDRQHQGNVTVRLNDDPSDELEVGVSGIKVHSRAIGSQWGDRTINADEIVTLIPRIKSETPSSLRNSSTSLNKKKVLNKVGIVVTLSVGCDWEKEKETIMRIIRTNGGSVLDDWSDIFSLAGEYLASKRRWVITSDNIGTETKHDIQQVLLISDAANTKPRFLTALALGIPCISVEWLRCLSSGQCAVSDWPRFLLPAGYSDSLGARVSQMVDLDWGTTLDHLTGIMSNTVATKLFSQKSVLVLGPEYFPPPAKGKKGTSGVGDEKSNDGGRFIPRIIISMGAARVEAVPELKYASNPDLKGFQYVVVKDMHERPSVGGEKYVSMEWVKDCLIAGRTFPPRV